jgi:hypothetical protein
MAVEVSDAEMQQDEARSWDLHEEDAGFVADLPVEPEPEALDAPGAGREEAAPIDESGSLFICREFTLEAFAAWFAVQELGTKPYNGIGVHHTYRPTGRQFFGAATTRAIFDYYTREFGWKFGKGPHLWLYGGDNPDYKPGQTLVSSGHIRRTTASASPVAITGGCTSSATATSTPGGCRPGASRDTDSSCASSPSGAARRCGSTTGRASPVPPRGRGRCSTATPGRTSSRALEPRPPTRGSTRPFLRTRRRISRRPRSCSRNRGSASTASSST